MTTNMILRSSIFTTIIIFGMVATSLAQSKSEIYTDWFGVAIKGYDPVAYHAEGKPVKGSKGYELQWKDAKWRFASAENKLLFEADPDKYAPQYGGYCAWAVSRGYTAGVDPKDAWRIVDDKLYLNYSPKVKKQWEEDIPGNIKKGDANWPDVLK